MPKSPPVNSVISWVYTQDVEETFRFYGEVLGLRVARDAGVARIFALSDTSFVGVCKALDWRVVEPRGGMLTLVTDDVDGWYQHLQASGAPCRSTPEINKTFGIYAFLAEDPNGYLIEFQQFLDQASLS